MKGGGCGGYAGVGQMHKAAVSSTEKERRMFADVCCVYV